MKDKHMTQRQNGKIKWYNSRDGYGFIVPDDGGKDIFMHHTKVEASVLKDEYMREDARVSYELKEFRGRIQAEDIKLL